MSWGRDPDVALFVGGPKDGEIEALGGINYQVVREDPYTVSTFGSPAAKMVYARSVTYALGKVSLGGGTVVTVMYDQTWDLMRVMRRAESAWVTQANYWNGWQQLGWTFDTDLPKPRKSPEEATAWLHDGKGKDFL